jgi:hypothetical protein
MKTKKSQIPLSDREYYPMSTDQLEMEYAVAEYENTEMDSDVVPISDFSVTQARAPPVIRKEFPETFIFDNLEFGSK